MGALNNEIWTHLEWTSEHARRGVTKSPCRSWVSSRGRGGGGGGGGGVQGKTLPPPQDIANNYNYEVYIRDFCFLSSYLIVQSFSALWPRDP